MLQRVDALTGHAGSTFSWLSATAREVFVHPYAYPHTALDTATGAAFQAALVAVLAGVFFALAVSVSVRVPRSQLRALQEALPGLGRPVNHSGLDFYFLSWSPDVRDSRDRTTMPIFLGDSVVPTASNAGVALEPVGRVTGSLLPGAELRFSSAAGTWAAVRRSARGFDVLDTYDAVCAEVCKQRPNGHTGSAWAVEGTPLVILGSFADPKFLVGQAFVKVLHGNSVAAQVEARNDDHGNASFHCSVDANGEVTLILACLVSLAEFETISAHDA